MDRVWWEHMSSAPSRVDFLKAYRDTGLARAMTLVRESVQDRDALQRFVDDARAAGFDLQPDPGPALERTAA